MLYGNNKISWRQNAADLLLYKVEEKLRTIDWFGQLDTPIKQNLLVKYALLRMYQSSVLNNLKGLHPSITDRVHRSENFVEIIPVFSTFSNFFKKKKKIIKAILCNFSMRLLKYF